MKYQIIIPAHNEEQFIGQTLESLVNQTLPPKNILLVNDKKNLKDKNKL